MHILVAVDDYDLNRQLCMKLESEQYEVLSCSGINHALKYLRDCYYDALILSVPLPSVEIYGLFKAIRSYKKYIPVIILSDNNDKENIITMLDMGADDYIIIPFDYDILLARLRVILRSRSRHHNTIYTCHDLRLNSNEMSVTRNGIIISLTPREYSILEYMLRHRNMVLTREQLQKDVWDLKSSKSSNVVDVYIRYLRKKIDDNHDTKLIHTIRGLGYRLSHEE